MLCMSHTDVKGYKPSALLYFNMSMFALAISIYFRLIFTIIMGSNASIMLQQEDLQTICQQTG